MSTNGVTVTSLLPHSLGSQAETAPARISSCLKDHEGRLREPSILTRYDTFGTQVCELPLFITSARHCAVKSCVMLNPTTGHTEFMSSRRALQNVDILDEIFQHLSLIPGTVTQSDIHALYSDDAEGKLRTLASAVLVCKSFSEPASRVLWSVLPHGINPSCAYSLTYGRPWTRRGRPFSGFM